MQIEAGDIIPLGQVRARLTEVAEEARAGREKIVTRNGEAYVAVIDARRLDHYHQLEREHILLTLLDDAEKGLDDLDAGRTQSFASFRRRYARRTKQRR